MSTQKRVRIRVHGRVQGVYYRYAARQKAGELGLKGWVQNLPDGTVELLCEGADRDVDAMTAWCRRGPPGALVDHADLSWEAPEGEFPDFAIRY